ncbi:MAG: RIO1 family regulatory kinase/ATPase [Saccharolobus sp.]|jgi:RIO kinase 2|uniref:serine/threonine-protein kinase RIO2 n=1 Tax=Saccharolobus sp. TaxID=2100761 RepID=UPI0028CE0E32|nr:RIO1 family regulatory kinase/ATPase [Saccharolobus sp.]MDT7861452.1 RIO1 family regulatory kinase/ATPase [Saccharolobus sp.]
MRLSLAERASLVGPFDYIVLKTIYEDRDKSEYVHYLTLKKKLDQKNIKDLKISLLKLNKLKLVFKDSTSLAFKLTFSGLDILAIKMLYVNHILNKLGSIIGEGKESIVYLGYDFNDNPIVIKFHRIGRNSYKSIRRREPYKKSWITISVENAEREYKALKCVYDNGGKVPRPLGIAYNAVAMEYIDGIELYRLSNNTFNFTKLYNEILGTMRIAYTECKIAHGDLSPYNILIDKENNLFIIDWPQASQSEESLKHDIRNIVNFFRKFGINDDPQKIFDYVRGIS